ncbi:hypothetical protein [Novacetimonas pomaceti]|nr:hypothetical protein [Novacetimonas pomaceti]
MRGTPISFTLSNECGRRLQRLMRMQGKGMLRQHRTSLLLAALKQQWKSFVVIALLVSLTTLTNIVEYVMKVDKNSTASAVPYACIFVIAIGWMWHGRAWKSKTGGPPVK